MTHSQPGGKPPGFLWGLIMTIEDRIQAGLFVAAAIVAADMILTILGVV